MAKHTRREVGTARDVALAGVAVLASAALVAFLTWVVVALCS